jgi:adenosylcobinamide-phosphate synthase
MAAMAGALRVQLEKPGQYVLGEPVETLGANKILVALRIRNAAIILCVLSCLPIMLLVRLFFFPF